jgi:hypothetical protein
MVNEADAKERVEAIIGTFQPVGSFEVTSAKDIGWGWVVFYSASTGELVAGNAPYIVDKQSGEVLETGTAEPLEVYIRRIEKQRGISPI